MDDPAARELLALAACESPGALMLARLASPAPRIEAELLRAIRIAAAPHIDAGAEGDLWFGPLVDSRGAGAVSLEDGVAAALRKELASAWQKGGREAERVRRARSAMERVHETASPALALEERLAWIAIEGGTTTELEDELWAAVRALEDADRPGVAHWATQAWPRLPPAAQGTGAGLLLRRRAAARLNASSTESRKRDQVNDADVDVGAMFRELPATPLAVAWKSTTLSLGDAATSDGVDIMVPEADPCWIEVTWLQGSGRAIRRSDPAEVRLPAGKWLELEAPDADAVRLVTMSGDVYEVARMSARERPGQRILGAVPFPGGVTFRVWAPNAIAASVVRIQETTATVGALAAEPGGVWAADIDGARVGDHYLYRLVLADGDVERLDPRAWQVTHSVGHAIVYDQAAFTWFDDDFATPDPSELVIYEMHVGTFHRSANRGGDLATAITKLPYLRDLGINAIELMPVAEFRGESSWGYNPSLPFAVESAYAGPDGLKSLVQAAHDHGIAVLLDVVYNHLGPTDVALWAFDGPLPDAPGGIYFYGHPLSHTPFGATRPDYGRVEVREYIRENARAWLEHYHIDGLRVDGTGYVRNIDGGSDPARDIPDGWRLLQEINDDVDTQPRKLTIAEDMQNNDWVTRSTGGGGAGFDAQWDPDFVRRLRATLVPPDDRSRDMNVVAGLVSHCYSDRAFARVVYTESHDAVANGGTRLPTQIDPSHPDSVWAKKRSTLGAALVFTVPGIPMLFQGQEFLEPLWFSDDHPLDWVKAQTNAGIVALYRDLIRLRRDFFGTTRGLRGAGVDVHHLNDADKVIGFRRWDAGGPGDDVIVLANFSNRAYDGYAVGVPRSGTWQVRFNSDWAGYDPSFPGQSSLGGTTRESPADRQPCTVEVGIGAYSAVILSQDGEQGLSSSESLAETPASAARL